MNEPTMKEIAEWLFEAEAVLKDYESQLKGNGRIIASHDIQCLHEDFADRAAQVEAMGNDWFFCPHCGDKRSLCRCDKSPWRKS